MMTSSLKAFMECCQHNKFTVDSKIVCKEQLYFTEISSLLLLLQFPSLLKDGIFLMAFYQNCVIFKGWNKSNLPRQSFYIRYLNNVRLNVCCSSADLENGVWKILPNHTILDRNDQKWMLIIAFFQYVKK